MRRVIAQTIVIGVVAAVSSAACTHATVQRAAMSRATTAQAATSNAQPAGDPKTIHQPTPQQRSLGIYQAYSDADIDFMSGMIPHHAQAVIMAGWAPSHGARKDVAILCERIVVGQTDEIRSMQTWLRDRGL